MKGKATALAVLGVLVLSACDKPHTARPVQPATSPVPTSTRPVAPTPTATARTTAVPGAYCAHPGERGTARGVEYTCSGATGQARWRR